MDKTIHYCDNSQHHQINHHQDIGAGAIGNLPSSIPKQGGEDVEGALIVPSVLAPSFQSNTCFGNERVSLPKATSTHHKYTVGCNSIGNSTLALERQGIQPNLKWADKCLINLDHFQVQIAIIRPSIFNQLHEFGDVATEANFHFEFQSPGQGYRKVLKVYWHGEEYGFLSTDSINENCIGSLFKLSNIQLYQNRWLYRFFEEFLPELGAVYMRTSQIDIALDGGKASAPHRYFELISKANDKRSTLKVYKCGKGTSIKPHYQELKAECNQWDIGSKKSPRYGRNYNKSKELRERASKPWIEQYFNNNSLNQYLIGSDIYRFEMVMKSKEIERVHGFDVLKLDNPDYLLSLLKYEVLGDGESAQPFLKFYREGIGVKGGKVRNSPPSINPLMKLSTVPTRLARKPKKPSNGVYKAKMTVSTLVAQLEVLNPTTEVSKSIIEAINHVVKEHGLQFWFKEKHTTLSGRITELKIA